jgi:hypothetical protein
MKSFAAAFVAIVALSIGLGGSARAQMLRDGTDLFEQCRHHPSDVASSPRIAVSLSHCYGFMKGVGDAYAIALAKAGVAPGFCPPGAHLSGEQSRLVFMEWARENPEQLDKSAAAVVTEALIATFPCGE